MKKLFVLILGLSLLAPMAAIASPVPAQVAATTTSDVDNLLSQLDKVVSEYVSLSAKTQAGDMEAAVRMASVSVKMDELVEKLDALKEKMTMAQLTRYAEVVAKLTASVK